MRILTVLLALSMALILPGTAAAEVNIAAHSGRSLDGSVRWSSTYRMSRDSPNRLVFDPPLTAGTRILDDQLVAERDSEGRIIALRRDESAFYPDWLVRLEMPGSTIRPPYPAGEVLNAIELEDVEFNAGALSRSPLELRLGYVRHRALDDYDVGQLERFARPADETTPIYLVTDADYRASGGVDSIVADLNWRWIRRWTIIIGLALAVIVISLVAYLLLKRQARREEVEAFLNEHEKW